MAAAIGLVLGCASEPKQKIEWYKLGASPVERSRALSECRAVTGISPEDAQKVVGGEIELHGPFTACMREKGFVWSVARSP